MSSTDQPLDTDLQHAYLLSKLIDNPVKVDKDVYMWNGYVMDRETAVVALLKVYSQLPVSDSAKQSLFENYKKRWQDNKYAVDPNKEEFSDRSGTWFFILCKNIKGKIYKRTPFDIKQQLITLHS